MTFTYTCKRCGKGHGSLDALGYCSCRHRSTMTIERTTIMAVDCTQCKKRQHVKVKTEDLANWHNGALIQDAMPYLTVAQREILVSGLCGTCFDNMCDDEIGDADTDDAIPVLRDDGEYPTETSSFGPSPDAIFNGMAQLVIVPSELRQRLRKEVPLYLIDKNALNEDQRCHHITMAFKATCGEMEDLRAQFHPEDHTVRFLPLEIRSNRGISAIFGDVIVKCERTLTERVVPGPHHITVAANEGIKPAESKKLATDYLTTTAWERHPDLPQVFGLAYNVVSF